MSDTDHLTASPELRELRDRLIRVDVPAPPPVEAITARGRARRRHRLFTLAGVSVTAAAVTTALTFGLTGVSGPGPTAPPDASARAVLPPPAKIRTAAFTIVGNRDGTVTLTFNPLELFDATALENDLAQFDIPAMVTPGRFCSSDPAPGDLSQVVSYHQGAQSGGDATIVIDPTAMPAGSKLSFGILPLKGDVQASYSALVDASNYTCTDTPPTDADPHPARFGMYRAGPSH
jgi:hypothetical protein